MQRLVLVAVVLTASGCASASYTPPPPDPTAVAACARVVGRSFDEAWDALVQHAARSFFAIDTHEKASGLMTLSFTASEPERFVTGGHWKDAGYEGDYVSRGGGELAGRVNVVLRRASEQTTEVMVSVRYVFTARTALATTVWTFDSGGSSTVDVGDSRAAGTPSTRTLRPTHALERSILEAVERPHSAVTSSSTGSDR